MIESLQNFPRFQQQLHFSLNLFLGDGVTYALHKRTVKPHNKYREKYRESMGSPNAWALLSWRVSPTTL